MSASASSSLEPTRRRKGAGKARRKAEEMRLPTPPPDPSVALTTCDHAPKVAAEKEDFLEYLETLQRSPMVLDTKHQAQFAPAEATEHAINHLDKLYKLMGQMLTLREQNILLHRRIVDLERLRGMQCMDAHVDLIANSVDLPPDDQETANAESLLYDILVDSKKEARNMQNRVRKTMARKSFKLRRAGEETSPLSRRISMASSAFGDKPAKVSKWTKVKAAFKWEKAAPTVSDAKSQDSGLGMVQPLNYEVARYLRVPSTSEDIAISPADSGTVEVSITATLSSGSSVEELRHNRRHGRRRATDDTSEDEQIFSFDYIPCTKDDSSASKGDSKQHRTPWLKVKDMMQLQTRNTLKKRHRLSTKSDEVKSTDDGLIADSDNEEVFESEDADKKSPILVIQSAEQVSKDNAALSLEHNIPIDIIARYQYLNEESCGGTLESKWAKVKRAFLTSPSSSKCDSSTPTTPEPPGRSDAAVGERAHNEKLQLEIQENYLKLQRKLSLEFQEKMQEWERSRFQGASIGMSSNGFSVDDPKEAAFKKKMEEWQKIKGQPKHNLQLKSEENLPPEFRKKLEEWKKIKKGSIKEDKRKAGDLQKWKSFGSPKTDLENMQLSDEFRKKYETWRQIKSGATTPEEPDKTFFKGNKSPSPKLLRRIGSKISKHSGDKELQWLGKGIEREKQRLERDKQKFFDREQRLTKSRRSVVGHNKKEVLVQTPSGFYRFEGISRKFTQKLYEWEKARGIRPEESTFALLNSSCIPHIEAKGEFVSGILMRSKSADSVMNAEQLCPLLSQRPSSLSLNELENLEEEMLLGKTVPDIIRSSKNSEHEQDLQEVEPEAVIIEVEDVVEETASFSLINSFTETHFPVYQKQETNKLHAGETNVGPTVRRSESARAQTNYNLIEEIIEVLKHLAENENDIDDIERIKAVLAFSEFDLIEVEQLQKLKLKQEKQKRLSEALIEKLIQLQDANSNVAVNIAREEPKYKMAQMIDVLDTIQDLTTELFGLAESIDHFIYKRNKIQLESDAIARSRSKYPQIGENLHAMKTKILELRRNLSYLCAASDIAVVSLKQKAERPLLSYSTERKRNVFRKSRSRDSREEAAKDVANSPTLRRETEQGAVKKRMRYRQKELQSKAVDESDDDEDALLLQEQRKAKPRRMRSQNSTESNKSDTRKHEEQEIVEKQPIVVDPGVIEKILVPTTSTLVSSYEELCTHAESTTCIPQEDDKSTTVFVKTTRKVFTPPIGANSGGTKSTDDDRAGTPSTCSLTSTTSSSNNNPVNAESAFHDPVVHLPPIPSSPIPQRKSTKEISPNIRLMMVRYNQKINEEAGLRSGGSSGSASPVAWRSPVLERRVKAQTERYQQELQKMSPLLGRREVQKSASMGLVVAGNKQVTIHKQSQDIYPKSILKSSSTSYIKPDYSLSEPIRQASPIPEQCDKKPPDTRIVKLQKAKEEFLNGLGAAGADDVNLEPTESSSNWSSESQNIDVSATKPLRHPAKNRLSQVSIRSDLTTSSSSYGMLMKSASAGMINIDPKCYKQFNPEVHDDGYVSLPRSAKSLLSNIKSKIRNVKLRRNKDRDKEKERARMNTVSTLCRQSLVVDINNSSQETLSEDQTSKLSIPSDSRGSSTDTSPSTSRTSSWIKRSKIFNTKKM